MATGVRTPVVADLDRCPPPRKLRRRRTARFGCRRPSTDWTPLRPDARPTHLPILDESGAPRGFAGRLITGDGPKYLNTPETDLYQKRSLLYGIHLAGQPIVDAGKAVVVEGYTDAIAAHQAGFTNVVATGG